MFLFFFLMWIRSGAIGRLPWAGWITASSSDAVQCLPSGRKLTPEGEPTLSLLIIATVASGRSMPAGSSTIPITIATITNVGATRNSPAVPAAAAKRNSRERRTAPKSSRSPSLRATARPTVSGPTAVPSYPSVRSRRNGTTIRRRPSAPSSFSLASHLQRTFFVYKWKSVKGND